MEVKFTEDIIMHRKEVHLVDIDVSAIFLSIVRKGGFDINHLSEDDRGDIILEFESNYEEHIEELYNIKLVKLPDDDCSGYDIGENAETIEKISKEFAEYVWNFDCVVERTIFPKYVAIYNDANYEHKEGGAVYLCSVNGDRATYHYPSKYGDWWVYANRHKDNRIEYMGYVYHKDGDIGLAVLPYAREISKEEFYRRYNFDKDVEKM